MDSFWDQTLFHLGELVVITPGKIAVLLLAIPITWLILWIIKKMMLSRKNLSVIEKSRRISLFQLARYLVWVISISYCITFLGFSLTLIMAGSAALLVGIGFGLQNIFSDFISGLIMLIEGKVKVGDVMEVENIVGKVQDINLRTSVLLTRDGYNIIVPNHKFITDNLINWSHQSYERRFEIQVGVSYKSDIDLVTSTILECCLNQSEVIKEPPHNPNVRLINFGNSSLDFQLLFWTSEIFSVEQIKSELRYKIFKAFHENNITIPFPQRDVHLIQP